MLTVVLLSAAYFSADAQEFEIRAIGFASPVENMTFAVDPDDVGRVTGRVLTSDGRAVAGVSVVVYDGLNFYGVKSKKDGTYTVGAHFGVHAVEAAAPGYRKYRGEADISKGRDTNMDIVLEPVFDGMADVKVSGNGVACKGNALTVSVNAKHPAYKGKSLADVLRDVPMLTVDNGKFIAANNDKPEFYLNGKPFRAPFAAALKFFGSIDAAKAKSIRIMTLGAGNTVWVSISYNE